MKYCKKCLQPDTRPGTKFDNDGICPACNYFYELKNIDWDERNNELNEIVEFGRNNNSSGFDSIIGISGGKDSTRQALFVKNELKMNPLLVCLSYPPEQVTKRGTDNLSNLINLGFTCISINPSPQIWRKLMRKSFFQYTNWCRSTELALFSSVPRLAIAYQIPLIWWGENTALQLGDSNVLGKSGSDGNNLRASNTLSGGDFSWLLDNEIQKNKILQYIYPSIKDMKKASLKISFLGYFWKLWSLRDNGLYSALRGLDIRKEKPHEIGDITGVTALDEDWVTLNQMIKYYKYGFGRVADYINEDIRNQRITREQGIQLLKKYDGKCSTKYILSFCEYIGITIEEFWLQVDKSVNKKLFHKVDIGNYIPKFKIGIGI